MQAPRRPAEDFARHTTRSRQVLRRLGDVAQDSTRVALNINSQHIERGLRYKTVLRSNRKTTKISNRQQILQLNDCHRFMLISYCKDIKIIKNNDFINYVNLCSARCHLLTPDKKTLIAPYGTNLVRANDKFIGQLTELDVDFIAYQDEVGVRKTKVDKTERLFEKLRVAHDKAGRAELWADIELFDFEGMVEAKKKSQNI